MSLKKTGAEKRWIVIIEWDGQHPPRTWYRYLQQLAGSADQTPVRGNKKDASPLKRRAVDSENKGLVIQEGCVICPSQSLAYGLAHVARNDMGDKLIANGGKRPDVLVGEWEMYRSDDIKMDDDSDAALGRVMKTLGRRGRRPDPVNWVISCKECLGLTTKETHRPLNCPSCGGLRILAHKADSAIVWYDDGSIPIVELWQRTRWGQAAHWQGCEVSTLGGQTPVPLENAVSYATKETGAIRAICSSQKLLGQLEQMDRQMALEVLDAILIGRSYYDLDSRMEARVKAISYLFGEFAKTGANPPLYGFAEPPQPDLMDVSTVMGSEQAYVLASQYGGSVNE
jgi:hypothetical protein